METNKSQDSPSLFPIESLCDFPSFNSDYLLHTYYYPAYYPQNQQVSEASGIIFYFHGHSSYCGLFKHLAVAFSAAGFHFVGYDYRGFGKSQGPRGSFESVDQVMHDGLTFVDLLKKKLNIPTEMKCFGMGNSLGGTTAYALNRRYFELNGKELFQGMILMTPASLLRSNVEQEDLAKVIEIAKVEPNRIYWKFTLPGFEYMKDYFADELYYREGCQANACHISYQILLENIAFASKVSCPIQILIGSKDSLNEIDVLQKYQRREI